MVLERLWCPGPHVAEQGVHSPQLLTEQFIGTGGGAVGTATCGGGAPSILEAVKICGGGGGGRGGGVIAVGGVPEGPGVLAAGGVLA
jgi:hypothetical protein